MQRILLFIILLLQLPVCAAAGGTDSAFQTLNAQRIHTDLRGMRVLAGWGIINAIGGIAGAATADADESKHLYQMNAAWGAINCSIAGLGYIGARRELGKKFSAVQALHRYEATQRLYLLNAGLDGLYISTGVFLTEHAKNSGSDAALYRGFGKSLLLQGAGLLLFDVAMFTAHHQQHKRWYRALQEVCITGDRIGWRWPIR